MAITALDHVSLLVADPAPVVAFYTSLLGFEVRRERDVPMGESPMHIIDLRRGADFVEVIQSPDVDPARPGGVKHVAFRSDDIEGDFERFRASGARLLHAEVQRAEGMAFFFVRSPAGEWVEIIQYSEASAC